MHKIAAGIPILTPRMSFEAGFKASISEALLYERRNSQISHHTGAGLLIFPTQIRELTNEMRQAVAVHSMNAQVPEFHAWICQRRGITLRTNPRNAKVGKRG